MSEVTDIAEGFISQHRQAASNAVATIDADPEKAARAIDLSNDTGVPAAAIHADMEGFEQRHKSALTTELLRGNPHLTEYINSHPLASSVSNDDYANLDKLSQGLGRLAWANPMTAFPKAVYESWPEILEVAKEGLHNLARFPQQAMGEEKPDTDRQEVLNKIIADQIARGLSPAQAEIQADLINKRMQRGEALQTGLFGVPTLAISPAIGMFRHYISKPIEESTGFPKEAVEGYTMLVAAAAGLKGMGHVEAATQAHEALSAADPWLRSGKEPPVGVHPLIDELKIKQSEEDLKALDESFKDAQTTATRERSPDLAAGFAKQHVGEARIGISADALERLYGDKAPELDDGKLGWVPRIAEQYEMARATGGDIEIPLSEWLAKADPEVAKELHDDIRVRPGGVTKNEAAELKKSELAPDVATEPVQILRQATKLEPMLERKLTLERTDTDRSIEGEAAHGFNVLDQSGKPIAELYIAEEAGGKHLYIDDIRGLEGVKPGDIGFALRQLLPQLKVEFPNATELMGFRVSGARDKAGTWETHGKVSIKLDKLDDADISRFVDENGELWNYASDVQARVKPTEFFTENEQKIISAVDAEIARLTPKQAEGHVATEIKSEGKSVRGMHIQYTDRYPIILWSINAENPISTVRHEAIHHLRQQGFFTKEEWAALSFAAVDEGWIDKHKINTRYKELNNRARIEEAIAEEFGDRERKPAEGLVGKAFERLKDLLDSIKSKLKELFGKDLTVEDVFNRIERGEVGAREGNEPKVGNAFKEQRGPAQPELPGTRRVDDRKPFATPAAVGITAEKQRLYERLIAKRNAEDLEKELTRAKKEQEKRLTVEWKANEAIERQEAVRTVNSRPDVAADNFFSEGKAKFASDALTPEQKAILPKEWVAKDGASPDDLASLFSYHTGDELIDRISAYQSARKASGMKPLEYTRRLVEIETAKQMEAKYGSLEKNILAEVKDQVLSETQLDLLHEEVLREGLAHGVEYSITKEQVKSWAQENIRKVTMENLSSDKYLAEVGKAGSAIELAHLKGDTAEAFRQAQRKEFAFQLSREALKIEELKEKFDKKAKAYQRKELPNIQPEYVNYTRLMLQQLGEHFRYVNEDLVAEGKRYGYDSFADFVRAKEADFRDLHVPEFLLDPSFRKPLDQLTAGEFEQVHAALTAMDFNGRDELKLIKAGEKHDLNLVLDEMVEKLKSLGPPRQYPIDRKENWAKQQGKNAWWSGITVESMLNRVDRDNPRGVFNQYLVRPFTEASNYKDRLIREFQAKVSEIGKVPNIDTKVANDLFVDPITSQPFLMRKRNVLGILQNSGNINNLTKLAKGYGLEPDQVMSWLAARTTKEDWDRAQKLGDIFNEVFEKANTMSHNVSGVGIQKLPLVPIQTPFGEYAGWYNPIKYDSLRPGKSKALLGPNVPEAEGYYRATTPQGYTEQRTGYIAPVELDLDIVPIRMKQMLHDIAMRPAVIQLSKVFYNDRFKRAMINHLGEHQAEAMIPFLRDIANAANFKSMAEYYGNQGLEFFRQNTIATLIGLNPSTVMKHGPTAAFNSLNEVGIIPFAREFATLVKSDEATNQRNWTLAMDKSEELQRRMRNYTELFAGHGSEINIRGAQTKFSSYREFMMHVGATPVSISDLLSAVPTWLAKYKEEKANNATEGDAVNLADRAVRRAHGSSVLSNKPAIARTNALGAYFSSLYGFFSHMQQKHYELGWKAKDLLKDVVGKGSGDEAGATRHVPDLLKGFMSYIIIPALIEEMVTPYTNSEKESWGMKAAKTLGLGLSSSYIGVRDFVRAIVNVRDPQAGLVGTTLKAGSDLARDLSHGPQAFTRDKAGNIIKHGFALTGILTGLTNAQEGRFAEYLWRYNHNLERPKGPWELAVGMRYGKTDKHSRSFDQWLKH